MGRWSIVGAVVFGVFFTALVLLRRADAIDSHTVRAGGAVFLFVFYCALVIFGTSGKKRTLSLTAQTWLGVVFACAIAALFRSSPEGYMLAIVLGIAFGLTADWWARHVPLP
jgi:hypothetical protein